MKSKKILIASQDDSSTRSLSDCFHDLGYKIEMTQMVSEMIRKVRGDAIHVILIDDELEGIKACDLVALVKKINSKVQVVVTSSEESLNSVKRLRGAGIFYQAMKPMDLEEIKSAVACAFQKIEREDYREGFFSFLVPKMFPA